tara:strand:- start:710 stop:982 length:273 start_codon:yes stop_codon:yes gene_type:complete
MKITATELVFFFVACLLAMALFSGGCATAPKISDPQQCCERLHKRDVILKRFERVCIALAFLDGRFDDDPRASRNIKEGLDICKYVYDVR